MTLKKKKKFKRRADHQLKDSGIFWGRKKFKQKVMLFTQTCFQDRDEGDGVLYQDQVPYPIYHHP